MNIKEVAKLAGVSVATVSRTINNHDGIKPETREKILQVIKQTGYVPNLVGRNLRQAKSKKLLAIIPNISNSFYTELLRGISDIGSRQNYDVLFVTTNFSEKSERQAMELLFTKQIDGVISFLSCLPREELKTIIADYPYVQCCEVTDGVSVTKVTIDNFQAGYDAASYFWDKGHRDIAMISGRLYPLACRSREAGFRQALNDRGGTESRRIEISDFSYNGGYEACGRLFAQSQCPTALFAASDDMAIGAIRYLQNHGRNVPGDVEVIGFDNNEIAAFNNPTLSTVAQPRYEMGSAAAQLLIRRIANADAIHASITLPHKLIFRESTGHKDESE